MRISPPPPSAVIRNRGAEDNIGGDNQKYWANTREVRLDSRNNILYLQPWGDIINRLVVDDPIGNVGIVDFGGNHLDGWRSVKIDELEVVKGTFINIAGYIGYEPGDIRYIAIKNVSDARYFVFTDRAGGLIRASTSSRRYDGYWELHPDYFRPWTPPPIPEPATYGAAFGVVGLGLGLWRRRRRAVSAPTKLTAA